jgi:hypothetical protein
MAKTPQHCSRCRGCRWCHPAGFEDEVDKRGCIITVAPSHLHRTTTPSGSQGVAARAEGRAGVLEVVKVGRPEGQMLGKAEQRAWPRGVMPLTEPNRRLGLAAGARMGTGERRSGRRRKRSRLRSCSDRQRHRNSRCWLGQPAAVASHAPGGE